MVSLYWPMVFIDLLDDLTVPCERTHPDISPPPTQLFTHRNSRVFFSLLHMPLQGITVRAQRRHGLHPWRTRRLTASRTDRVLFSHANSDDSRGGIVTPGSRSSNSRGSGAASRGLQVDEVLLWPNHNHGIAQGRRATRRAMLTLVIKGHEWCPSTSKPSVGGDTGSSTGAGQSTMDDLFQLSSALKLCNHSSSSGTDDLSVADLTDTDDCSEMCEGEVGPGHGSRLGRGTGYDWRAGLVPVAASLAVPNPLSTVPAHLRPGRRQSKPSLPTTPSRGVTWVVRCPDLESLCLLVHSLQVGDGHDDRRCRPLPEAPFMVGSLSILATQLRAV